MTDTAAVAAPETIGQHLEAFLAQFKSAPSSWAVLAEHAVEHLTGALSQINLGDISALKAKLSPLIQEAVAAAFTASGETGILAGFLEKAVTSLVTNLVGAGLDKLAAIQAAAVEAAAVGAAVKTP